MTAYDKYMYDNYYSIGTADDPYAGRKLNRKELIKDPNYILMNIMLRWIQCIYQLKLLINGLRTVDDG
jgi:hypothetical protein